MSFVTSSLVPEPGGAAAASRGTEGPGWCLVGRPLAEDAWSRLLKDRQVFSEERGAFWQREGQQLGRPGAPSTLELPRRPRSQPGVMGKTHRSLESHMCDTATYTGFKQWRGVSSWRV